MVEPCGGAAEWSQYGGAHMVVLCGGSPLMVPYGGALWLRPLVVPDDDPTTVALWWRPTLWWYPMMPYGGAHMLVVYGGGLWLCLLRYPIVPYGCAL